MCVYYYLLRIYVYLYVYPYSIIVASSVYAGFSHCGSVISWLCTYLILYSRPLSTFHWASGHVRRQRQRRRRSSLCRITKIVVKQVVIDYSNSIDYTSIYNQWLQQQLIFNNNNIIFMYKKSVIHYYTLNHHYHINIF